MQQVEQYVPPRLAKNIHWHKSRSRLPKVNDPSHDICRNTRMMLALGIADNWNGT